LKQNNQFNAYSLLSGAAGLMRRMMKELPDKELSLTERMALLLIFQHKKMLPSQLASAANLSAQLSSKVISNLVRLGYIKKSTSPEDKRKSFIALTVKGEQRLEASKKRAGEWFLSLIENSLNDKEKGSLESASQILHKLTGQIAR
jgi:DNA-binding MarR family transcriptional regulator